MSGQVRQFGRYTLLYRIATGGMAKLYVGKLAGEDGFTRLVALKVIHEHLSEQPEFVKMFIDEARLASRISHPNVALTLDLGRVGQTHFIAMEYVEGESLAALMRRNCPPLICSARIIADAAAGLHAAHELRGEDGKPLQVVHRDVSPQNILISYDGAVKVVDFGVARVRGSLHTTSEDLKGKVSYMAPEQIMTPALIDHRIDIYALGVLLYEMTTWQRLFKAEIESDALAKVIKGVLDPPSQIKKNYPPDLEAIVMRALAPQPADRFQTAHEMQEALEKFIMGQGEPVLPSTIGRMMRKTFDDRIKNKQALLAQAEQRAALDESLPQAGGNSLSLAMTDPPSKQQFLFHLFPTHRQRIIALLFFLMALSGSAYFLKVLMFRSPGAAVGLVGMGGAKDKGVKPPQLQGSPQEVKDGPVLKGTHSRSGNLINIAINVVPPNATLLWGGAAVTNPFETTRPADKGHMEVVALAAGYDPQRIKVPLTEGGQWTIVLARKHLPSSEAASPPHQIKRRSVKESNLEEKKRSPRGGRALKKDKNELVDEDVLDNPYK